MLDLKLTDEIEFVETDSNVPIKIHSYGWIGDILIKHILITDEIYHIYIDFNDKEVEILGYGSHSGVKYNSMLNFKSYEECLEILFSFPEDGIFIGNVNLHRGGFQAMFYSDSKWIEMMTFSDKKDIKLGQ